MYTNDDAKQVEQRIEMISKRIADRDYCNPQEKHNLQKERWLLKKHLEALKAGLNSIIIQ